MKNLARKPKLPLALLTFSLVCTLAAVFLPFSAELLLGLAGAGLAGYAAVNFVQREELPRWFSTAVPVASGLSILLTLVLILFHKLRLVPLIAALDLFVIAALSVIALVRKNGQRVALIVLAAICAVSFVFGAFSHIAYGRTVMATVAEWVLASQKVSDDEVADEFQEITEDGEELFAVKSSVFRGDVCVDAHNDMPFLVLNSDAEYDRVIFYIHGGYYVYQMGSEQMTTMDRLAKKTDALIIMPLYHLAPFHTVEDGYETMMSLYERICRENEGKKIVLMGDSAGGGFALALAEGLRAQGLPQPEELILMSPWVDVTMSNPDMTNCTDPMLTVTMGQMSGEAWAGNLPMDDWHVSPINGDLTDLGNVTIFVGTRELFYPDNVLLYNKLRGNGNVTLHVGKGLNHVYPVYPTLEGRIAVEQIVDIIQR